MAQARATPTARAAVEAVRSLLRAFLHDFPDLPEAELNDGTPDGQRRDPRLDSASRNPAAAPPTAEPSYLRAVRRVERAEPATAGGHEPSTSWTRPGAVRAGGSPTALQLDPARHERRDQSAASGSSASSSWPSSA